MQEAKDGRKHSKDLLRKNCLHEFITIGNR